MKKPEKKQYPLDFSAWCEHNFLPFPDDRTKEFDWCYEAYNNICEIWDGINNAEYNNWLIEQSFSEG